MSPRRKPASRSSARPTQLGRALGQLGVEHIAAYSPEARGRSERAFRTPQDRLPREPALQGIVDVAAANRYLGQPTCQSTTRASLQGRPRPVRPLCRSPRRNGTICCASRKKRIVAPDDTVSRNIRRLQIPPHPARAHFVRATVRVHAYPNGETAIFPGPRCLVRWRPDPSKAQAAGPASAAGQAVDGMDKAPPRPLRPQHATTPEAVSSFAT